MSALLIYLSDLDAVEYGARTCTNTYAKFGSKPDYVQSILKLGHFSILEHAIASFEVVCSRACSHQLVRHRHFSFSQQSQRYVSSKNAEVVIPTTVDSDYFHRVIEDAMTSYNTLQADGAPKEDARYVLPNAVETMLMMTGNLRSWLEFFQKRLDKPAQWEIKGIAKEMWDQLSQDAPHIFNREILELNPPRDYSILD
jgi:thymidylate synthase (FAD)